MRKGRFDFIIFLEIKPGKTNTVDVYFNGGKIL